MAFRLCFLAVSFATSVFAVDVPGGLTHTASGLKVDTYEMVISPAYVSRPMGGDTAYLSSDIRYQPNEDFTAGFGFGAGELGYNFGLNGAWYLTLDTPSQPAVSILGGIYFNRFSGESFFVTKVIPIISKQFELDWGTVTPYTGAHIAPSFRLGVAKNEFSLKTTVGSQFGIRSFNGVRLWTEFGIGFVNSGHEFVMGLSYPFSAIIGS